MSDPRFEPTRRAARGMVCTVDHIASGAGVQMLAKGGSAADAAVAASAVLAVTTQHMCGMGGDLWALVHDGNGAPTALNSSGRAGSGSDAGQLRSEGHSTMPFRGDMRSVPVPGCVDGWTSLHDRYGRLPLAEVLEPAAQIAETGFAPTDHLESAIPRVLDVDGAADYVRYSREGGLLTRPGLAEALRAIGEGGRNAWYQGRFGEELIEKGGGLFSESDLARSCADWVNPIRVDRWGHTLWTVPPNSQGYLTLLAADIGAELLADDVDPDDPRWAHLLIEASKQAAVDRSAVLHESTSIEKVFAPAEVQRRRSAIDPKRASRLTPPGAGGGTIYLCAVDDNRMGVFAHAIQRGGIRISPGASRCWSVPSQPWHRLLPRCRSSSRAGARRPATEHVVSGPDHHVERSTAHGAGHDGRRRSASGCPSAYGSHAAGRPGSRDRSVRSPIYPDRARRRRLRHLGQTRQVDRGVGTRIGLGRGPEEPGP